MATNKLLTVKPGKRTDILVAHYVFQMSHEIRLLAATSRDQVANRVFWYGATDFTFDPDFEIAESELPRFSSSIDAAMLVEAEMLRQGYHSIHSTYPGGRVEWVYVSFANDLPKQAYRYIASNENYALAICGAALKAVRNIIVTGDISYRYAQDRKTKMGLK